MTRIGLVTRFDSDGEDARPGDVQFPAKMKYLSRYDFVYNGSVRSTYDRLLSLCVTGWQ